jgi:multidrug efflux system outer membrane protein
MMRPSLPVLALLGALLAGCTVGPNYREPALPTPPAYQETGAATTSAAPDLAAWWLQFHDPTLDSLIVRALAGNLDIQAAGSRIVQARQQEIIAGAAAMPRVNASANVSNTNLAKNAGLSQIASQFGGGTTGGGGATGLGLPGTDFTTYSAGFDASWELDLFGQTRRAVEAARGRTAARLWSLRDTEVSVAAEAASDYLALRSFQRQLDVARDDAGRQHHLLTLIQSRRTAGFASELDVSQQQAQLSASQAAASSLEAQVRGEIHALGVLLGQPPEALSAELTPPAATPPTPPAVPVGLPSELLRRRPDIRVAERNLAAATADVGVAVGDLYPKISLTGSADLASESLRTLVSSGSLQTAAAAAVTQAIFNGGLTRANIRSAEAARREAYIAYEKSVLTALKEVEDALSRTGAERSRNAQLRAAEEAASQARTLAEDRYRAGLSDLINVLTTEGAQFSAESQLAQSDGQLDQDLVAVYKALGGGWSDAPPPAAPPPP